MAEQSLHTTQMNNCLDRWRAGDLAGRDELLRVICDRLERLTRKMLKSYPNVQRFEMTDDVFQNAVVRLLHSLEAVRPGSTRDFYNLAAAHIRRELLDLARRYASRFGSHAAAGADSDGGPLANAAARADAPGDLDRWSAFHEAVETLPVEEREIVGLCFYHDWSQAEIAELFQIDERTVRRRWTSALSKLHQQLNDAG